MARAWFFLVLLNSSSFSATRLSISCLTWASSSCARSTLFSSISKVASASSKAACSSSFSVSNLRPSFSKLVKEILDFISKILILAFDNIKLLNSFILNIISLGQPFPKNLVKVLCTLLSYQSSCMNSFKLFNASHTFSFIARLPELDFSLCLRKCFHCIRLAHSFIFKLFSQVFKICRHHLKLSQEGSTILSFSISKGFAVLKLSSDRNFALVHVGNSSFQFFNLPVQVLIFNLKAFLCRLCFIQGSCHFIKS